MKAVKPGRLFISICQRVYSSLGRKGKRKFYFMTLRWVRAYSRSPLFRRRAMIPDWRIFFFNWVRAYDPGCREFDLADLWARNFWDDFWHPQGPHSRLLDIDLFAENTVIKDRGYLEEGLAQRRGVILVSAHFCFVPLIYRWAHEVEKLPSNMIMRVVTANQAALPLNYTQELIKSTAILKNNGITCIIADGYQGKNGFEKPFLFKQRMFYRGAWELALMTRAVIVPAWIKLNLDGRFMLQFFPPFNQPTQTANSNEAVMAYLDQYIKWLETRIVNEADSYKLEHVLKYLSLPQVVAKGDA